MFFRKLNSIKLSSEVKFCRKSPITEGGFQKVDMLKFFG